MTSSTTSRRQGLTGATAIKAPVKAATTAAITLSGEQTIDGYAAVTGDRVLVKDQSDSATNGVYVVDTSLWTRDLDFDGALDVQQGSLVFVINGTVSASILYELTTADPITVGTTGLAFTSVSPGAAAPADGSISTAKLAANAVTYAKMQTAAANTVLGNPTNATAVPSETALALNQLLGRGASGNIAAITLGSGLTMTGTSLSVSAATSSTIGNVVIRADSGSAPSGSLECDGTAVSRSTYAALFAILGTTWGSGDGTTFNLPLFNGKTLIFAGSGTVTDSGANADVDTSADTLAVPSNNTKWVTGMAGVFTLSSGTITGLSSGNTYYVVRNSSSLIKLASSLANAQNGTVIDLTAKSSPVWTITHTLTTRTLAEVGGQESHAMTSTEQLSHTHTATDSGHTHATPGLSANVLATNNHMAGGNAAGGITDTVATGTANVTNTNTGGNVAMNVMQPFACVRAFIYYQ